MFNTTHWKSALSATHGDRYHKEEFSVNNGGVLTKQSPTLKNWNFPILFMSGLNTIYSCQIQVTCSWKCAWWPQSPRTNGQRVALYHHMHERQEDCKVSTADEVIEQYEWKLSFPQNAVSREISWNTVELSDKV